MRVVRSTYGGAAEWRAQRQALREAQSAGGAAPGAVGLPLLEPAVVVSGPGEHADGAGVLIEAVGPDGTALYRRFIPAEGSVGAGGAAGGRREDVIEAGIQEAWRRLVRQVGPPDGGGEPVP